jgi:hypothetical protein
MNFSFETRKRRVARWQCYVVACVGLPALGSFIAKRLNFDPGIGGLVLMSLTLALLCAYLEWQRHMLRQRLATMGEEECERLALVEPEIRFSRPAFKGKSYLITMLVGQLSVNVVLLPAFLAPLWLVQRRFDPNEYPLTNLFVVVVGFLAAWMWWSVSVSAWRWWAIRYRDMSTEEVQWRGEAGVLLWPENHWCTRTALYAWLDAMKRRRQRAYPPT